MTQYHKKVAPKTTTKYCLQCQEPFQSIGPANRRCDACTRRDGDLSKRQATQDRLRGNEREAPSRY